MSITCPKTLDTNRLREEVSAIYSRVAAEPEGDFHFHRGLEYAARFLDYDPKELAALPATATASFAGVGNPHAIGPIEPGERVLDIGSGAGMDLLLAAKRVGPSGRAIGVDMTPQMRQRALAAAHIAGLTNVEVRAGDAEALPVEDASVDVVISNGVLNLVPGKRKAYFEIARVLRPGGRLLLADIAVEVELDEDTRSDIDLWTG
jgi:arsenite methyltransferase